ncbi:hypothetical protein SAMN02745165_01082 [Malonomonas rubra DSM 5091]|uniref:Uncharacterized protein n=1 Tax=Malonomonas rubra DSM 5091 TaxID=1122189 RepID=A0A1M6EY73_MALRU|nr:hypothetical protein [Malonomonas rubra]SHI90403.1 hypothetical protein SAMN02745165_01082 [Malonomonas rubra DSM 5091]
MSPEEIKEALLGLSKEEKQAFILDTLPDLAKEVVKEPGFMMQLFPVLLGILKESGMDLQQLLQMATMMSGQQQNQ